MTVTANLMQIIPGTFRPTLHGLRHEHPTLFYPQTWWDKEAFARKPVPEVLPPMFHAVVYAEATTTTPPVPQLYDAVTLAALYVTCPNDPLWQRYLWTSDTDGQGQRVYVGTNGHGLELHRHLHLTERWGWPLWP